MVWRLLLTAMFLLTMAIFQRSLVAQETSYLDDRSSPQLLIASYFNALNKNEFARAWSYWDNEIEGTNFEDFVEGFTGVEKIGFKLGKPVSEGAAGSIFTQIPYAMMTQDQDGWVEVYQGCFLTRIATPNIQSPPFVGLHFWEGYLKSVEGNFENIPLGECSYLSE